MIQNFWRSISISQNYIKPGKREKQPRISLITRIKNFDRINGLKHNKNVVDELARRSTKVDHYSGVAELALRETSLATPQLHNNPVNHVRESFVVKLD